MSRILTSGQGTSARILSQSAIPFIHISSGSIGNNGALTGVTAVGLVYGGAYCYFPADTIATGVPAGWYWTVFSSTTAGTIYNSVYTSGTPAAGVATPFVTTGPGAFTGSTSEIVGPSISVAANAIGPNGRIRARCVWGFTNSAGVKTPRYRYSGSGGTVLFSNTFSTQVGCTLEHTLYNAGTAAAQRYEYLLLCNAVTSPVAQSESTLTAIDTTAATTLVLSLQKAAAADNIILASHVFELMYGA